MNTRHGSRRCKQISTNALFENVAQFACPQWIGPEVGGSEALGGADTDLAEAVRELGELVARRRLARHALLGAALRLRVPEPAPRAAPAASTPPSVLLLASCVCVALAAAAGGSAWIVLRRRRARAVADRDRRCDEEKSNNLQNEENLRRYANPLRDEPAAGGAGAGAGGGAVELRAHSLYKAQNADARNDTPPRDKELTMRALPPPEPPPARHPHPHPHPHSHPPPERLTVLV